MELFLLERCIQNSFSWKLGRHFRWWLETLIHKFLLMIGNVWNLFLFLVGLGLFFVFQFVKFIFLSICATSSIIWCMNNFYLLLYSILIFQTRIIIYNELWRLIELTVFLRITIMLFWKSVWWCELLFLCHIRIIILIIASKWCYAAFLLCICWG